MIRHHRALAALLLAAAVVGCHVEEPFARTNHWDKDSDVEMRLDGPDSVFSLGDTIFTTLTSHPPLPPPPYQIEWFAPGTANLTTWVFTAGESKFIVSKADAVFQSITVGVNIGTRKVSHTVMVGQKVALFSLNCGGACDATPLTVNTSRSVFSVMEDAHTNSVGRKDEVMRRATLVSRNPAVLSTLVTTPNAQGTFTVRGLAAGNTWFVVSVDGKTDSVHIVVTP